MARNPHNNGILSDTHLTGIIRYDDGQEAHVTVIKLGLAAPDAPGFGDYRKRDRRFPYHHTFWPPWKVMRYDEMRVEHYREIGRRNATRALAPPAVSP